jgi:hypothetical protein
MGGHRKHFISRFSFRRSRRRQRTIFAYAPTARLLARRARRRSDTAISLPRGQKLYDRLARHWTVANCTPFEIVIRAPAHAEAFAVTNAS